MKCLFILMKSSSVATGLAQSKLIIWSVQMRCSVWFPIILDSCFYCEDVINNNNQLRLGQNFMGKWKPTSVVSPSNTFRARWIGRSIYEVMVLSKFIDHNNSKARPMAIWLLTIRMSRYVASGRLPNGNNGRGVVVWILKKHGPVSAVLGHYQQALARM